MRFSGSLTQDTREANLSPLMQGKSGADGSSSERKQADLALLHPRKAHSCDKIQNQRGIFNQEVTPSMSQAGIGKKTTYCSTHHIQESLIRNHFWKALFRTEPRAINRAATGQDFLRHTGTVTKCEMAMGDSRREVQVGHGLCKV